MSADLEEQKKRNSVLESRLEKCSEKLSKVSDENIELQWKLKDTQYLKSNLEEQRKLKRRSEAEYGKLLRENSVLQEQINNLKAKLKATSQTGQASS